MLINGTAGNDTLLGTALEDEIQGFAGNDDLDGKAGTDLLAGGEGNDTYRVDDPEDAVVELDGEGRDQVIATFALADSVFALPDFVEDLILAGTLATDGAGNLLDNRLAGNGAANLLVGGEGNDTLEGGGGADILAGGTGNDVYLADLADDIAEGWDEGTDTVQASVTYTLPENVERLVLAGASAINGTGNELDNVLTGNAAANRLDGAAGNDTLDGGGGNDTYVVDSAGDAVVEDGDGGTDAVEASVSCALPDEVERLTLTGTADIDATGNGLANVLTGNAGANRLDGGAGNDTLAGGLGDDSYIVDSAGDQVSEAPLAGADTVYASVAYVLPLNLEDLVLTGAGAISGTGNILPNSLTGNDGANTLDGAAGNDTLAGAGGNDVYLVDSAGDQVVEAADGGEDTARTAVTWTLPSQVEHLVLLGSGAIDGTGNALDNRITGNAGANRLDGALGTDTLEGAAGNDTYVVERAGDLAIETAPGGTGDGVEASLDYQLPDYLERLSLTGTADLDGWGNGLANSLNGNAGANRLDGGGGADTMTGGAGNDTYRVDVAADRVVEAADGGEDTVITTAIYALPAQVENLVLAGSTALHGTGNALPNRITGNDAANVLDGGAGADTLAGGAGNDTYAVDEPADRVIELPDGGTDTVRTAISLALPDGTEILVLTRGGLVGTGNDQDNVLSDLTGNSTFAGGAGNDTYYVNGADKVIETAGNGIDTVIASVSLALPAEVENLSLTGLALRGTGNALPNVLAGNALPNTLTGGAGNDTLDGAGGNDVLAGGAGDDLYLMGPGAGQDRIVELAGEGIDTVRSDASFSLAARPYVENLSLAGSALAGTGNTLANLLTGNAVANVLSGGAGNDTLAGQAGADSLVGGTGADVFRYGVAADSTVASADTIGDFVSGTDRIEFAGMVCGYDPTPYAWGGSVAATVAAIAADGAKADHLVFFTDGTDGWLHVSGPGFGASFDGTLVKLAGRATAPAAGEILGILPGSLVNGTEGDDHLAGTAEADVISGRGGNDTLDGLAGNDTLVGGTGNDQMAGGEGDDAYFVDSADDSVTEDGGEGTDLVQASVTYALADPDVENLTLTGAAAIDGTGNAAANLLVGNGGANRLDGQGAADTMAGGAGNDTYVVDDAGDAVSESPGEGTDLVQSSVTYALADPDIEDLVLTGSADLDGAGNDNANALTGNPGSNLLAGGGGNDTLAGEGGTDTLDGGTGADALAGGDGGDVYIVDDAGDTVSEDPAGGTDAVQSSIDFVLPDEVEQLQLTGGAAIDGTGNALPNQIDGNDAANRLSGDAGDDVLFGFGGDDTLDGGTGGDEMNGGAGNDTYLVDDPTDSVGEGPGGGTDAVVSSVSYDLPAEAEILTLAGTAAIDGGGAAGAESIHGNVAANVLTGRAGADTLEGGDGQDSFRYLGFADSTPAAPDTIADFVSGGDRIEFAGMAAVAYSTTPQAWAGDVAATVAAIGADAGIVDRVVFFTNGADGWLYVKGAGLGTDFGGTLIRLAGMTAAPAADDLRGILTGTLTTGTGDGDTLTGTSGADAMYGLAGDDSISGLAGNDILSGGTGNDSLDGGAGADNLAGGDGDDTYIVDDPGDAISDSGGADLVRTDVSYALPDGVERLTLVGYANIAGTGNALANVLNGNDGDNLLDGGTGADALFGGLGNDTYVVDDAGDTIGEDPGKGTDLVLAGISLTLPDNVENLHLTGHAMPTGTGNALDNLITGAGGGYVLLGGAGNDTLDGGGAGVDTMRGGSGNDLFIVDAASDLVTENAAEGDDTVSASVSYTLADPDVENLVLTGTAALAGTGNGAANRLAGNDGDNTLDGGAGADTLAGGLGNDVYLVDDGLDAVQEYASGGEDTIVTMIGGSLAALPAVEHLTLSDAPGNLAFTGSGNGLDNRLTGNSHLNSLYGDAGNDTLLGGSGDNPNDHDTLDGGTGTDSMAGGAGNDVYWVDNASDIAFEAAGQGTDTVRAAINYVLGAELENLVLTGAALTGTGTALDNELTGNGLNNLLTGLAGHDTLTGAGGNDSMAGGTGNDTYYVEQAGDLVTESAAEGIDTVIASVFYTLADKPTLENLTLTGSDVNLTGNAAANVLTGNAANNVIDGGAGADTMAGGAGNDTYWVDNVGDLVTEGSDAGGTDDVRAAVSHALAANVENLTLTGTASTSATGNGLGNLLTGNAGNNTLDGGAGADTLNGGAGNDTYVVDNAGDSVTEDTGAGTDLVQASVTYTLSATLENLTLIGTGAINGTGNAAANLLTGNSADNSLSGGDGNDTLAGGDGSDILDGGAGTDSLAGGAGNDTYVLDSAGDLPVESAGGGTDSVTVPFTYGLPANFENLTLTGTGNINGTGNGSSNIIHGNNYDNILDGGGSGADLLNGNDGNDSLYGGADSDLLFGGNGNDLMDGDAGADTMTGGNGNDTYLVDHASDQVNESLSTGFDVVISSVDYTLADPAVEKLVLTDPGGAVGQGNSTGNWIVGNAGGDALLGLEGDDTLDGGAGSDTLTGHVGDDVYVVDDAGDVVVESGPEFDYDAVWAYISHSLAAPIERLILQGTANIDGTGNARDNWVEGNAGNNLLDGGFGNDRLNGGGGNDTLMGGLGDTLNGGAGNDVYIVDGMSATVEEAASGGIDLVQSSVSFAISDPDVENLTLTGSSVANGTGNDAANVLTGNNGANVLDGLGGADTMAGGAGNDTYVVDNASDTVTESAGSGTDLVQSSVTYALTDPDVENLTLLGAAAINGTGNASANVLSGNGGDNVLSGLGGADTMAGGAGNDTFVVDDVGDSVAEAAGEGTDLVQASVTYALADTDVENLTLTGAAAINGTGNASANLLTGNTGNNSLSGGGGNDTLNGGTGADSLAGGAGDDLFQVDNTGDTVSENAGEGTDHVQSSVTWTLSDVDVENLTLTGTAAIHGTGNTAANYLTGNTGNNSLSGGGGNDTLDGGAGSDSLVGGAGDDWFYVDSAADTVAENAGEGTDLVRASVTYTLSDADVENLTLAGTSAINGTGNAGDNTLVGNTGANVLTGAAGSDSLSGGGGNDSLYGGAGNDTLSGGSGTDGFVFNTALGSSNVDDIPDFTPGTDGIGLENAVFTTLAVGALPAAAFYAGSAAHDSSDRIIYNAGTGALYYDADGSGFLHLQVQFATLDRGLALAADDFLVV